MVPRSLGTSLSALVYIGSWAKNDSLPWTAYEQVADRKGQGVLCWQQGAGS